MSVYDLHEPKSFISLLLIFISVIILVCVSAPYSPVGERTHAQFVILAYAAIEQSAVNFTVTNFLLHIFIAIVVVS